MSTIVPPQDGHRALKPPQFSLRTLFFTVTILCCVFALMSAVGAIWSLILSVSALLIAAHVIGNALGTMLRDGEPGAPRMPLSRDAFERPEIPPASNERMTENTHISRLMIVMAALGAMVGGIFGGAAVAAITWRNVTWGGLVLAVCSSAVLGGFAGFLLSSFATIARGALREALDVDKKAKR